MTPRDAAGRAVAGPADPDEHPSGQPEHPQDTPVVRPRGPDDPRRLALRPPTPRQVRYLAALGHMGDLPATAWDASRLIADLRRGAR